MLVDPSIETLKTKTNCSYQTAILVAKRARQLNDGAQPMVGDKAANVVSLACCEVIADRVVAVDGEVEPVVPITKEERERRKAEEEKRRQALEEQQNALAGLAAVVAEEAGATVGGELFDSISSEEADAAQLEAVADDEE